MVYKRKYNVSYAYADNKAAGRYINTFLRSMSKRRRLAAKRKCFASVPNFRFSRYPLCGYTAKIPRN